MPVLSADILTPLPAMGIDFTIVPGRGPKILSPVRNGMDVAGLQAVHDPHLQLPFLGATLQVCP